MEEAVEDMLVWDVSIFENRWVDKGNSTSSKIKIAALRPAEVRVRSEETTGKFGR